MDLFQQLPNYTQPQKKQRMYSPTNVDDGRVGPTLTISP